ncbi:MAG: class I SAM-dependent methyltransferase [Cyanothece sp. SIO1E1]|nr:class I SAM-dependent methyltransferase [Cyanothece sp. SIO1E1]
MPRLQDRILSNEEAKRYYNRFGHKQDRQVFYEEPAIEWLLDRGDFEIAEAVFEFGCGTGRLAQHLLAETLTENATYFGCDISSTMVELTETRLANFGARANVHLSHGETNFDLPDGSYDRFLSAYVFDLLSPDDIRSLIDEAHRLLVPGGMICLAGITNGNTPISRTVTGMWRFVNMIRPRLLGGCRPLELLEYLPQRQWSHPERTVIVVSGIASEAIVARKQ